MDFCPWRETKLQIEWIFAPGGRLSLELYILYKSNIWVVSFTLVTLLRHMCSPTKLFDVDDPWIVRRSTFLLVGFQNWHFYLKTRSYWHLQILFIYVMSENEMKKPPTTSTSKSLTGEEYVRQQFMLYL